MAAVHKVIYVARFRPDLGRERAGRYWTEVHAPMADDLDGFVGYIQNHVTGPFAAGGDEPPFDGYACEWWRDRASYDAGMKTESWQAIVDDGPEFLDTSALPGMGVAVQESVLAGDGGPAPRGHKLVFIMRFREDIDRDEAARHWREVHGPLALAQPGVIRYVQNLVTGAIGDGGAIGPPQDARFDGLAEVWFEDESFWSEAYASKAWQASYRDCFEFLDMSPGANLAAAVEQRVIKSPG